MKILFICQYYAPEPFRHPDICRELVKRGYEVFVVTGLPNYPLGEIYEGYGDKKRRDDIIDGVKVHRCFTVPRKTGTLFRFLNYYSFAFSSTRYVKKIKENFDVVLVHQLSPVMMAKAALAYKRKRHTPAVLYCLDLWPESLVAGGVAENSLIYKFFHRVSRKIYRGMDKILVTSPDFADYFKREFGIENTEYLPQYAEDIFVPETCKKIPDGKIDLMFAGNIGTAQGIDTVIEAARLVSDEKNLYIHIVGDGSESDRIKAVSKDIPNIIFHGRKPLEEMPEYYSLADAMLVTLKGGALNATLPGKVQTYLAAGKPVIASADGITADTVKAAECGLCSPADDAAALAENIRKFITADRSKFSKNAYAYYNKEFSKESFILNIEKYLRICL